MKKLIRKGVFETNSSSCHSITIEGKSGVYDDIPTVEKDGSIFIRSGEFGWEIENYDDFGSKASYIAVYIRDWVRDEVKKSAFKEIFENIIIETTGCDRVEYENFFWDQEETTYEHNGKIEKYMSSLGEGYIDHQSVESSDYDYLFEDIDKLKNFLFNSNSILHTDNDNY